MTAEKAIEKAVREMSDTKAEMLNRLFSLAPEQIAALSEQLRCARLG